MVEKLYASGICNKMGSLYTGGKLKEGEKYILDNTRCCSWDDSSVDISEYNGNYHYGVGERSWFNNITDLRPATMQQDNIW